MSLGMVGSSSILWGCWSIVSEFAAHHRRLGLGKRFFWGRCTVMIWIPFFGLILTAIGYTISIQLVWVKNGNCFGAIKNRYVSPKQTV